ncbi:MAG: hypothetical protein GY796_35500 [Chloroflexi bacterium]|nr:hypothetical protein [Chloroflexota bacterium]
MIYFDQRLTMNEITIACDALACVLVTDAQGNMVVTPRAAMEPVNTPTKEKAKYMLVAPRSAMTTNPISANTRYRWHVQCLDCGSWFDTYTEDVICKGECDYCGAIYQDSDHSTLCATGKWIDPNNVTNEGKIK